MNSAYADPNKIEFNNNISSLEQGSHDELIVRWGNHFKKFNNIVGENGQNYTSIMRFNNQPAIWHGSVSSTVKSDSYYTLKVIDNEVFIDCLYEETYDRQIIIKTGVCGLHVSLDENYFENTHKLTQKIIFPTDKPYREVMSDFFSNELALHSPAWPLLLKMADAENVSILLRYATQEAFDTFNYETVVQYEGKELDLGEKVIFIMFDAHDLSKPAYIEYVKDALYENAFIKTDWCELKANIDDQSFLK